MLNIIVVGDAVVDTHVRIDDASLECNVDGKGCKLCLSFADKIPISGSFQSVGGDGANIASGAAKLGLKTALLATLGDDANAGVILRELVKRQINADFIRKDKKADTRYSVILNFRGERTILSFHSKRKYVWPSPMPAADWIYYTGLSEGSEDLPGKLAKYLSRHPTAKLAFTPGSYQLKNFLPEMRALAEKADVLIVNLQEAERLAGEKLEKVKSVPGLIHKLLIMGVKETVVTDGANGAWAGNIDEIWYLRPYPARVVAKTGAGDAFASGYVSARFYGEDLRGALEWGTANGCGVIGQWGSGEGLLDSPGIKTMIKKYKNYRPRQVA